MKKFEKCQLVMLPSSDLDIKYIWSAGKFLFYCASKESISKQHNSYHLYIISDDEIKKGDWFYWISQNKILQAEDNSMRDRQDIVKKIIATTDTSLNCTLK